MDPLANKRPEPEGMRAASCFSSTMKSSKVLAIIPARGGSKGIPRKNLRDLCGKPLIAYSIETALRCRMIDRVVVSTEDEEIAEVSKALGAEVPFMRPLELAQDRSNVSEAISHTLNALHESGYSPDVVVSLFPTHPFRTPGLVDFLVGKIADGHSPVLTVKALFRRCGGYFYITDDDRLLPLNHNEGRQSFFRPHGLFIGNSMHFDGRTYIHTIKNPFSLIDIDTPEDFRLAEEIISSGVFQFDSNEYVECNYPGVS